MAKPFFQRVGLNDYRPSYEVKGENVAVTLDGETREGPIGNQGELYAARDVVRGMIRDREKNKAA